MKLGAILAGLIFLFNPNINIVDILPDAIGIGLIFYGILPISRVEPNLSEAARYFRYLFITELVKLPALAVHSFINESEQLFILIVTMVFGALEIWFGLLGWSNLFNGIDRLSDRETNPFVTAGSHNARVVAILLTVAKPVLAILPDLCLLADDRYGVVGNNGVQSIKAFRNVFNVFGAFISLVIGIVFLVIALRYFRGVKKDSAFVSLVNEKAATYDDESRTLPFRRIILAMTFLSYAFLFCLELKIEGYSLIPPMIGGALFLFAFLVFGKAFRKKAEGPYRKWGKMGVISSAVYIGLSLVGWVLSLIFARTYYVEEAGAGFAEIIYYKISGYYDIFDRLLGINIVVALSQVAFGVMSIALCKVLMLTVSEFTGAPESLTPVYNMTEEMKEREAYSNRVIKTQMAKPIGFLRVALMITALSSAIFPLLQIYFNSFFMIDLVIRIAFVVFAYLYAGKLKQAVKVKGGLDYDD